MVYSLKVSFYNCKINNNLNFVLNATPDKYESCLSFAPDYEVVDNGIFTSLPYPVTISGSCDESIKTAISKDVKFSGFEENISVK